MLCITPHDGGYRLDGHTTAVEGDDIWAVHYVITIDERWCTRNARVEGWSPAGPRRVSLEGDGAGQWRVDGRVVSELDGCLDVDLESSACTNTMPLHRLHLGVGDAAEVPAAYVRAVDLSVERLDQHYARVEDHGTHRRYDYKAPAFGFEGRLLFDDTDLVLDYPHIARRVL